MRELIVQTILTLDRVIFQLLDLATSEVTFVTGGDDPTCTRWDLHCLQRRGRRRRSGGVHRAARIGADPGHGR